MLVRVLVSIFWPEFLRSFSINQCHFKWLQLDSNPESLSSNGWVFAYELSGSGFKQGVPWHSGNYRVWIHSVMRTWHDKNIQSMSFCSPWFLLFFFLRSSYTSWSIDILIGLSYLEQIRSTQTWWKAWIITPQMTRDMCFNLLKIWNKFLGNCGRQFYQLFWSE